MARETTSSPGVGKLPRAPRPPISYPCPVCKAKSGKFCLDAETGEEMLESVHATRGEKERP